MTIKIFQPNHIASYYSEAVLELGGCSVQLVTDLGTENGTAAALQAYFRDNPEAHQYVPSPRNQRIEEWWAYFAKNHCQWWRNFLRIWSLKALWTQLAN